MATRFTGRLLQVLDNVYRFVGGAVGLDQVELRGPIQLVHDVARETEYESLKLSVTGRGYFYVTIPTTHAIADTQTGVKDPYVELEVLTLERGFDIWLMETGISDAALAVGLTSAALGLVMPAEFPEAGTPITVHPVGWFATNGSFYNGAAGSICGIVNTQQFIPVIPRLIPRGATFTVRVVAAGAGTTQSWFFCWAGPGGSRPPLVA